MLKPKEFFDSRINLQVGIEEARVMQLMRETGSNESVFDKAEWEKSVKVVDCDNKKSLGYYLIHIN